MANTQNTSKRKCANCGVFTRGIWSIKNFGYCYRCYRNRSSWDMKDYHKEIYQLRIELGRCISCDKDLKPIDGLNKTCKACCARATKTSKKNKQRRGILKS